MSTALQRVETSLTTKTRDEIFVYRPASLTDIRDLAMTMLKGGFCPDSVKTPEAAMCSLMMGAELGLSPFQAIQNIFVVRGKPCMYVATMQGLCEGTGLLKDGPKITFEGEGSSLRCIATVLRVGKSEWARAEFSLEDARTAGLNGMGWQKYPKRMLKHRALGFVLQDTFPDILRGIRTYEEMVDQPIVDAYTGQKTERPKGPIINAHDARNHDEVTGEVASHNPILAGIEMADLEQLEGLLPVLRAMAEGPEKDAAREAYKKRSASLVPKNIVAEMMDVVGDRQFENLGDEQG